MYTEVHLGHEDCFIIRYYGLLFCHNGLQIRCSGMVFCYSELQVRYNGLLNHYNGLLFHYITV